MAKLTKKQKTDVFTALSQIDRAIEYITKESTVLTHKSKTATTTNHFVNEKADFALYPVDKRAGSNIVGLYQAKETLIRFLDNN